MSITGGILPKHLKYNVIIPVLNYLNLGGNRAINMVTGTGFSESWIGNFTYLKQSGNGPALGFGQMEPVTHNDIWKNYLSSPSKKVYADLLRNIAGSYNINSDGTPKAENLVGNLYYSAGMMRIFYLRKPEALPEYNNAQKMAEYYKKYYNTYQGKAKVSEKVKYFQKAIEL